MSNIQFIDVVLLFKCNNCFVFYVKIVRLLSTVDIKPTLLCTLFCIINQNWVMRYVRNVFFLFFAVIKGSGISLAWHPAASANQNWPQLSADYKFQYQGKSARATVCTVSGEIGCNEADKLLKNVAPKIYKPLPNLVQVKVAPTETMQPFCDRLRSCLQAWVMRHQLPIKIPVYCAAEVSLWLMEPMCVHNVSLQVSWCQIQTVLGF